MEQMLAPTTAAQRLLDLLLQQPSRAERAAMLPGCFEAPSPEDQAQVRCCRQHVVALSSTGGLTALSHLTAAPVSLLWCGSAPQLPASSEKAPFATH